MVIVEEKLKLEISKFLNFLQLLNMYSILVTEEVSNCCFILSIFKQNSNILFISLTLLVLKFIKSISLKFLQLLNI